MAIVLLVLAFATGSLVVGESDRVLPPVFAIPRNTTASLDVDLFFSLFFVFLNEDIKETSSDYTIFAPAGLTTQEAARWLGEEKLTEQLLLDHIVVGTHLRPELVASTREGPWTTLGGEEVSVAIDDQGEFRVNGVRVLAWTTEGPALIVVLEDYLFKEKGMEKDEKVVKEQEQTTKESIRQITEDKGEFPQAKPRKANQRNCTKVGSTKGRLSIFRDVTVCTETLTASPGRKLDTRLSLLDQVASTTVNLEAKFGPTVHQFLNFAKELGIEEVLSEKKEWTVLAPVDSAWMQWMPIDWGFNPFLVATFLNSTIQGLFIEGQVDLKDIGSSWRSLSNSLLSVTSKGENDFIGGSLVLGWRQLEGGRLVLLESVPGVTADDVDQLEIANPHLVSLPPIDTSLASPEDWMPVGEPADPMASLQAILSSTPGSAAMADFIRATPALSLHFGRGHNITLLVPNDEAFLAFCKEENQPCGKLAHEPDLRLRMLLDHLLLGVGLPTDRVFTTLAGTEITVTNTSKGTSLMPSSKGAPRPSLLLSKPLSVPGLGSLILIDAVIHSAEPLLKDSSDDSKNEQAFTTEESSVIKETPMSESNLKFEDDLLTINMGALLEEVRNDTVNFPADVLREKAEKDDEEIQEVEKMVEEVDAEMSVEPESHLPVTEFFRWREEEEEEEEEEKVEEELDTPESHLPVTEFFILDPRDKTSFDNSIQNSSPFFLLNRRNIEKKVRKVEKEESQMGGGKSLKTRVVYINNQRLELPSESR